jgi:hypothetical protein
MAVHRGAIGSSPMDGARPCVSALFTATNRIVGRKAASAMASAFARSFGRKTIHWAVFFSALLWRLTNGFTYAASTSLHCNNTGLLVGQKRGCPSSRPSAVEDNGPIRPNSTDLKAAFCQVDRQNTDL